MNGISTSAPGKIHLIGEHAVVYGAPAILAAIDKRVKITLMSRKDAAIHILLNNQEKKTSYEEILNQTKHAREQLELYEKTLDKEILKVIIPDAETFIKMAIGETLIALNRESRVMNHGFTMSISSQIPLGSGLGSSASIAVSVAAAVRKLFGQTFDKEKINEIAFNVEKLKHGFPSGADNATCCYGGCVWFEKKDAGFTVQGLGFRIQESIAENFVLIDTGRPKESTGEMVHVVKVLFAENQSLKREFLESQTDLAQELLTVLKSADEKALMEIIQKTEKNLESIGVVSPVVEKLIRAVEKSGGAAKICGAGGKAQGSGTVLAYHKNPDALADIADDFGMEIGTVTLGVEGVRIESID